MIALLLLAAVSFGISLLITPVCRQVAVAVGFVDVPDSKRKLHSKPVPRIGGVPIALAYCGAWCALFALSTQYARGAEAMFSTLMSIAPAIAVVFAVGLIDDIYGLKPWHKLIGELFAGGLVVASGIQLPGGALGVHPWIVLACSIVWLVACTNAVNLIDGLDGLAPGIALVITLIVIIESLLDGHVELAAVAVPLGGALLAFLIYNFHPASIFLGDSGSLVVGFLLGCYGLLWSSHSSTPLAAAAPLAALAIPLGDTTVAILRRFLRRAPVFAPDRLHIHHRLLAQGHDVRRVALVLYIAAALGGAGALCLARANQQLQITVLILLLCGLLYGIRQLGYPEFQAATRVLINSCRRFRRDLNADITMQEVRKGLAAAVTPYDCWVVMQDSSEEFGFHRVRMRLGGYNFETHGGSIPTSWDIRISLSNDDWVELSRGFSSTDQSTEVVTFADTICAVLSDKSSLFARSRPRPAAYSTAAN